MSRLTGITAAALTLALAGCTGSTAGSSSSSGGTSSASSASSGSSGSSSSSASTSSGSTGSTSSTGSTGSTASASTGSTGSTGASSTGSTGSTGSSGSTGSAAGRIVYSAHDDTLNYTPQVFSMNADGTGVVELTTTSNPVVPTGSNDSPTLSPDGSAILFTSGRDFAAHGATNPTLRMLYLMDPDGANPRRLTANDPAHCHERAGRYSSDGQWVVFTMNCDDVADPVSPFFDRLYRIHPDGTGQAKLTPASLQGNQVNPAFTADGNAVLFVQMDSGPGNELEKLDLGSGALSVLTQAQAAHRQVDGPAMPAPDGSVIYFRTRADGTQGSDEDARIESVAPDGTGLATVQAIPGLTTPAWYAGTARDAEFALSPDGRRFAFVTFLDASIPTFTVGTSNLDGTERALLLPGNEAYHTPFWR